MNYTVIACTRCREYKGVRECAACSTTYCVFCEGIAPSYYDHLHTVAAITFSPTGESTESLRTWSEVMNYHKKEKELNERVER